MAFLDGIGKKISVTSQSMVQKAKDVADITGLKSQISEEEKKIDKYCQNLGHMYYDMKKNEPLPELEELVAMIKGSYHKIDVIRENITSIENTKTCPVCGAVLEKDMAFCVGCGTKVQREEQAAGPAGGAVKMKYCVNCGGKIPESSLFCTKCGAKQN